MQILVVPCYWLWEKFFPWVLSKCILAHKSSIRSLFQIVICYSSPAKWPEMNHAPKRVSIQEDVTYLVISDLIFHLHLSFWKLCHLGNRQTLLHCKSSFCFQWSPFQTIHLCQCFQCILFHEQLPELSRAILSTIWLCEQKLFSMRKYKTDLPCSLDLKSFQGYSPSPHPF